MKIEEKHLSALKNGFYELKDGFYKSQNSFLKEIIKDVIYLPDEVPKEDLKKRLEAVESLEKTNNKILLILKRIIEKQN